jgi:translocation and assembly module TamA
MRVLLLALALAAGTAATRDVAAQEVVLALPPGADDGLRAALAEASLTLALERPADPQDIVAAARADYQRLLTAAYAQGFYGPVVSIRLDGREAAAIAPLEAPGRVARVEIVVDPGPRFAFGRTEIGPLAPATALPPDFAPGRVAASETIRAAVRAAVESWRDEGHAKADLASQEIVAVHPEARLDVALGLDPGPELTFGPVAVTGQATVRADRIRRIAGIPEGEVFSPAALRDAARRLRRSGAFDAIALVEAEAPGPGATLPIEIQVVESLPRRIGFGAEISSLDGLSANAFWLHRNLLGGAERLRLEAEVTGIEGAAFDSGAGGPDLALGASFARPATFAADNDLTLDLRLAREDQRDVLSHQLDLGVGITRYASETLTVSFGTALLAAREERGGIEHDYLLATLPLAAVLDRRDDPQDARAGFYLAAQATPFATLAGDGGGGARLFGDARLYHSLGTRLTLAGRLQAGSVVGAAVEDAPTDFLFLAGGGGSVRGLPFQSIDLIQTLEGPEGPVAVRTGGASLLGVQIEARVAITDRIGAVAFADAAVVGRDALPDFDGDDHGAGIGLGLRYRTPVGPIRFDIATPATGADAFAGLRLYIAIGQSF